MVEKSPLSERSVEADALIEQQSAELLPAVPGHWH